MTITPINKCAHPVWPGIHSSAGKPILARDNFELPPNKACSLILPATQCGPICCGKVLNVMCSVGTQVRSHENRSVVARESASLALDSPRYCCSGTFGSPQSCNPIPYSKIFKAACPTAYSNPYDDPTSIATCTDGNYFSRLALATRLVAPQL